MTGHRTAGHPDACQSLAVGDQLGHLEYAVTPEFLEGFRSAVDYPEAAYPNPALREWEAVLAQKVGPRPWRLVRQQERYYAPPRTGRRVQTTGWVRDAYRRSGADWLVVETFAVDEVGTEILRGHHTIVISNSGDPGDPAGVPQWDGPGESLPLLVKRPTARQVEQFLALGGRAAASTGPTPGLSPAPDALALAYLHELVARRFGIDFRQGGRLAVDLRRPVLAGDTLTARGLVVRVEPVDPEGDRRRFWLALGLADQRGKAIATGEAEVTVPSPLT